MKNVGKIFGIPMSLGGVHLISGIAQFCMENFHSLTELDCDCCSDRLLPVVIPDW